MASGTWFQFTVVFITAVESSEKKDDILSCTLARNCRSGNSFTRGSVRSSNDTPTSRTRPITHNTHTPRSPYFTVRDVRAMVRHLDLNNKSSSSRAPRHGIGNKQQKRIAGTTDLRTRHRFATFNASTPWHGVHITDAHHQSQKEHCTLSGSLHRLNGRSRPC